MSIIQTGNAEAASNCVALIFNIAYDQAEWTEAIVRQHNFS
jgi:hypothetical protein